LDQIEVAVGVLIMRVIYKIAVLTAAFVLSGCVETLPKIPSINDLPASPTLKDRNAAVAQAWDRASLECRAQFKPKGSFCEQLKTEGEFLSCSAERFAKSASALRYPAQDKIWVWHNCVRTTANQLKDGLYLSKAEIDKRMLACQARLDPEPEFPVRQSGWFAPVLAMIRADDKESVQAVLPGDFGINQSQVALPSCAARFAPQPQPQPQAAVEVKPLPVAAPVASPGTASSSSSNIPVEPTKAAGQALTKSKPKASVSTKDVASVSANNVARSQGTYAPTATEQKGACPIPGACGPTVPPDAVKRP
jgi:hypothetical protein